MRMNREYTTVGETLRGVELAFRGMVESAGIPVTSCAVVSSGETASVRFEGNKKTGLKISLCMPWVSQEANVTIADVHMFTASWIHEGFHVIDSDMDVLVTASEEGKVALLVYIEDVRIDTAGIARGSYDNALALRSERMEQLAVRATLDDDRGRGWTGIEPEYMGWSLKAFGLMINAGYDCPTTKRLWDALDSDAQAKWRAIFVKVAACNSTLDALELARELTEPQETEGEGEGEGNGQGNGQGNNETSEAGETGNSEGEGETGNSEGEGETGEGEGETGEGSEGASEGEGSDEGKSGEGTGDSEGEGSDSEGEGDGDSQTGSEGSEGSDSDAPLDFDQFKNNNAQEHELTGEDVEHLRLEDDESRDKYGHTEEKASEAISAHRAGTISDRRIAPSRSHNVKNETPVPAKLRNLILGLLRAPEKTNVRRFKVAGRFDSRALLRATTGAADVFKRRFRQEGTNTAVTLLVDCSISMRREYDGVTLMNRAAQFAYALSVCIEATGQSCEVFGFGDKPTNDVWIAINTEDVMSVTSVRKNQCSLFPVKMRREKVRSVLGKFDSLSTAARGGTPLSAAMLDATARLVNEKASRRILICLTDGQCNTGTLACKMAQRLAFAQGVEIIGIGCGYNCSESFYDSANFMDVSEMTQGGLDKLIKRLNHPARRLDSKRVA